MKIIEFLKKEYEMNKKSIPPILIVFGFIILFKILGWLGFPIAMVWSSGKWIYF